MPEPLVSVVIPAYNAADFIGRTLDSILAQTFTDYEIIVVDDGSLDDTKGVVETWLRSHSLRGRCIRQPNGRIAAARNTGMRAASGDWIALLDHDDIWHPTKLARCLAEAALHPEAILVAHDISVVQDGRVLRVEKKGPSCANMYDSLLLQRNCVSPSAAMFLKESALSIGGFREGDALNTVEDYDFWMRLSQVGPFRFIPEALSDYTLIPGGASKRVAYHHDRLEALLREHFARRFPTPSFTERCAMRRRMSQVYRSALSELLGPGADRALGRRYAGRMLSTWPLGWRNWVRAGQWLLAPIVK